jgi:rhomboid protease GluP
MPLNAPDNISSSFSADRMSDAIRTFGKRGTARETASVAGKPKEVARGAAAPVFGHPMIQESTGAWQPLFTYAMVGLLVLIYLLERKFAFEIGKSGAPNLLSIEAMGGASYNGVVGQGQWWRIFLAPLLHSTVSHLIGNCMSLLLVGMALEKTLGRRWTAALFVIGALGGVAGSLLGNRPNVMTVGASGAILGLVGALFVLSFLRRANPEEQQAMRRASILFGASAIIALVFGSVGSSGPVDNFAHLGGALAGAAGALFICLTWPAQRAQARFGGFAMLLALAGLGASIAASSAAIRQFPVYAERASHFIPPAEAPANLDVGAAKAADFLARYPADPRSHIMHGLALAGAKDLHAAQLEFSNALGLTIFVPDRRDVRDLAKSLLAAAMAAQGNRDAAKSLVAEMCKTPFETSEYDSRRILNRAKLCD